MQFRILILALGTFVLGTDGFVIAGILPSIAHSLGVPVATAGLLVTAFALAYAIGAPVLATATGNMPRRRLLVSSLACFTLVNIFAALAATFDELLLVRVVAAFSVAVYTPTAAAAAASLASPEKRGRALALVTAGFSAANVLGVPFGTWIGVQFGWRLTFVLIAVLAALAAAGVLIALPAIDRPPASSLLERLTLLRQPRVVVVLLISLVGLVGAFAVYTYLAPLLEQITRLSAADVSLMLLLSGVATVLGNIAGGYSTDRWGPVPTLAAGITILALAFIALPMLASSILGAAAFVVFWGLAGAVFVPAQQHRLLSLSTAAPGVALSLNSSATYLGIGGGAALGGLVLARIGLSALGWVGGGCMVIALATLFISTWSRRKPAAAAEPMVPACEARMPCPAVSQGND
ncbi:MAG TPA: MFS transporter [Ktedonobacterales bacterium]|nr:MFS transporter [Ktedonobacterales bacterium]